MLINISLLWYMYLHLVKVLKYQFVYIEFILRTQQLNVVEGNALVVLPEEYLMFRIHDVAKQNLSYDTISSCMEQYNFTSKNVQYISIELTIKTWVSTNSCIRASFLMYWCNTMLIANRRQFSVRYGYWNNKVDEALTLIWFPWKCHKVEPSNRLHWVQ